MRITESRLRRIIRDIIIEEENLNEGVLDFFMGSEEYRYVRKMSENIVDMLTERGVSSRAKTSGIAIKDVNLNIAREGGPYISGSLVLVDIGGNKEYLYEVASHVGSDDVGDIYPQMNVYFKGEDGGDTIFKSGVGMNSKNFKADFCVSLKVTFKNINEDLKYFMNQLLEEFRNKKRRADRETSERARREREKRKATRRREMGM